MVDQNSSYLGHHHHNPGPHLVDSQTKIQQTPNLQNMHTYMQLSSADA